MKKEMIRRVLLPVVLGLMVPASAAVWDFPALSTNYPIYSQLYSDVELGNSTSAPTASTSEGDETLSAVYAYLHPQSPYRYDSGHTNVPAYLARLRVLMDGRISRWQAGLDLNDISGSFQTVYAYMLMKHYRPADIEDKRAAWESGITNFCATTLSNNPLLYDGHILAQLWLNGDIRLAMGTYFGGVALSNATYQTKAQAAIDQVMSQAVAGDGATHYVGFNNEISTYRGISIHSMMWWWKITGSPEMKAALDKTVPYVPLSVEPAGFQDQSTAIPYKHMYNGIRGEQAALATAYLYGDRYNYYFGAQVENTLNSEYAVLLASLYQGGRTAITPPTGFIIHDRAIRGPRGRWSDWAFVANGRDPQNPAPDEHPDQGYDGLMIGKNTFVGTMALGSWSNNTALKAALDGVCPEFKNKTGWGWDWSRSAGDGGVYRFLSQDEKTATITRDTFGTLSTDYRLSTRVSAPATTNWGSGTDWLGEQVWLMTKDRAVGLVQISAAASSSVYGLDMRIALTGGRTNIIGTYLNLVEVSPKQFEFGELRLKINQDNFGGSVISERMGVQSTNDNYGVLIRLHDAADPVNDTLINYPSGTRRWAVIECTRSGKSYATSVLNVMSNHSSVGVLEVVESSARRFRLIQNLTGSPYAYSGNFWGISGGTATQHKSWTNAVDTLTVIPGNPIAVSLTLPAYGHAIIVSSTNSSDHTGHENFYGDIFTNSAPGVSLTAPTNGARYTAPAPITLTADASDTDGTVTSVNFYNGATLLGTDTTPPYAYTWTNAAAGSYNLTARATDNSGAVSLSAVAAVTVMGTLAVTGSAGTGGTVSPTSTNVPAGSNVQILITADPGYRIATLTINGTPAGLSFDDNSTVTNYTLADVQTDTAVAATFAVQGVAVVPLGTYYKGGVCPDGIVSAASANGATMTYQAATTNSTDIGVYANASATFTAAGQKLVYSYSYRDIVNTPNLSNLVRSGFDLGNNAALHFVTGYGNTADGRFNISYAGNPFNSGTTIGSTTNFAWTGSGLRFDDGNTLNVVLTLELMELDTVTGTNHSYMMTVDYVNADTLVSNQISRLYTGVNGLVLDKVYHLTPGQTAVKVAGDTWTITNANLQFIPAPATNPLLTLTGSAGAGGTVSPASTNVPAGSSVDFTITANSYYRIAALTANGTPVGSFDNNSTATSFTWSNVVSAGALVATFTKQAANDPAGTPYEWLAQFGLTNYEADVNADQDLDGLKTWQEYIAGTVPTNAASVLKAAQAARNVITWIAVSGRVYSVYWSTNLIRGFTNLADNILYPQGSYTNPTPEPVLNHYQVKVRMMP